MKLIPRSKIDLPKPDVLKHTALCSLLLFFAAHAFCFFNLTYSSGSVMLNISSGRSAQIAAGQYLLPIYARIRGGISSPLFVGLLSALYLTALNLLLVWLLRIEHPLERFMLCGATTVNAAVLSICASSLHTSDAAFLAMLAAALSCAVCLHLRLGVLPGALMLAGALALYPSVGAFFAVLMLLTALNDLLSGSSARAFLLSILRMVFALCAGAALYLLGHALMLHRSGIDAQHTLLLWGGNLLSAYAAPIHALLSPLNAYPSLSVLIRLFFALLCVCAVILHARAFSVKSAALLTLGLLLLPLLSGFTLLSGQEAAQITPAHCLMDILVVLLLCRVFTDSARLRRAAGTAFAVLFLGSVVFSNQVYLKKNLEFESTLSVMTRVIARIEETPGYQPGYTPVAVIGTPEDSALSSERRGFEHLSALDAACGNYAITQDTDMIWYTWEVLGYPLNFVSTYDLEQLRQSAEVQALPAFPQEGCCVFIGDTLVIRLS